MKIFFLLTLFLLSSRFDCYCCECTNGYLSFDEANIVFIGKVLKIIEIDSPYTRYEIVFKVDTFLKGNNSIKNITINTPNLVEAGCGIPFVIKRRYYVQGYYNHDGLMYTDYCSGTYEYKKSYQKKQERLLSNIILKKINTKFVSISTKEDSNKLDDICENCSFKFQAVKDVTGKTNDYFVIKTDIFNLANPLDLESIALYKFFFNKKRYVLISSKRSNALGSMFEFSDYFLFKMDKREVILYNHIYEKNNDVNNIVIKLLTLNP